MTRHVWFKVPKQYGQQAMDAVVTRKATCNQITENVNEIYPTNVSLFAPAGPTDNPTNASLFAPAGPTDTNDPEEGDFDYFDVAPAVPTVTNQGRTFIILMQLRIFLNLERTSISLMHRTTMTLSSTPPMSRIFLCNSTVPS